MSRTGPWPPASLWNWYRFYPSLVVYHRLRVGTAAAARVAARGLTVTPQDLPVIQRRVALPAGPFPKALIEVMPKPIAASRPDPGPALGPRPGYGSDCLN